MNKTTVVIILFIISGYLSAQVNIGDTTSRKYKREKRRDEKKAKLMQQFNEMNKMLSSERFVIEADNIILPGGKMVSVSSSINFIKQDSLSCMLQIGRDFAFGYNGMGGITILGKTGNYKLTVNNKHGSFNIEESMYTNLCTFKLSIDVWANGKATARIMGLSDFGGTLTYDGNIESIKNSNKREGYNILK